MSGLGARELIGLRNIGVMGELDGAAASGTSAPTVPMPPGADVLVLLRIGIFGVTTPGTVAYETTNGNHLEAGYAANEYVDTWLPFGGPIVLTLANGQGAGVVYSLLYVGMTRAEYAGCVGCIA